MAARLIDGKALALQVRERLATESAAVLAKTGMRPGLATILVGDDPASHLYVKSKQKACDAAGIYIDDHNGYDPDKPDRWMTDGACQNGHYGGDSGHKVDGS